MSQLILQHFSRFTYVPAHSTILPSLHLRHSSFSDPFFASRSLSSFSNSSVASPASHLILQPFCRFTYVTAHSPTLPSLHLRHSSFYNTSVASPTSQLILQSFRRFSYVIAHSPTFRRFTYVAAHSTILPSLQLRHSSFSDLPSLHLRHISFSNPSVASPTSQLIL